MTGSKILALLLLLAVLGVAGCHSGGPSTEQDIGRLKEAFALKDGATSPPAAPAAKADDACGALEAGEWAKAVVLLAELQTMSGLSGPQLQAVHNARGNAYVRLASQADKGDASAREALDLLGKANRR